MHELQEQMTRSGSTNVSKEEYSEAAVGTDSPNEGFERQKLSCAMSSPMSTIVANLYMVEAGSKALSSFTGPTFSHWFRCMCDTQVRIKTQEVETFIQHINSADRNIKFTREEKTRCLFLGLCYWGRKPQHWSLSETYTPINTYCSTPTTHWNKSSGFIRTLQHRAHTVPTRTERKEKEHTHKKAVKMCRCSNWAFIKSAKRFEVWREKNRTFETSSSRVAPVS